MNVEIIGQVEEVYNTEIKSERFKKRDFVVRVDKEHNGNVYPQYIRMQTTQTRCDILNHIRVGDIVCAQAELRGSRWEKDGKTNYFTVVECWRVSHEHPEASIPPPPVEQLSTANTFQPDDLPF